MSTIGELYRSVMTNTQTATRIALVTGGSRGLGRSMALHLAERGTDILLTYKANAAEADEVVRRIRALGRKASAIRLDVADSRTFEAFTASVRGELERTFGRPRLDILVNNAGTSISASIADTTEAQLDEAYTVHFKAPYLLVQKLAPVLADGGRILNVSSGLARFTMPGRAAYGAMKAAVEQLTRYMAAELAPRKITVNVLAPGAVATDFSGGVVRDNPQVNAHVAAITALGRVGEPDDIGAAAAMLVSPEMGWVTGQRIEVSGGMHL